MTGGVGGEGSWPGGRTAMTRWLNEHGLVIGWPWRLVAEITGLMNRVKEAMKHHDGSSKRGTVMPHDHGSVRSQKMEKWKIK
ncbi:hemimethylated DNA-binding domain-containing protein [Sesbania bispinosa]|nr:hemimethylated DNA-binding domain-containing protein [Sesbania bispinosa]